MGESTWIQPVKGSVNLSLNWENLNLEVNATEVYRGQILLSFVHF